MDAYTKGFMSKCSELGVNATTLLKFSALQKAIASKLVVPGAKALSSSGAAERQAKAWERLLAKMDPLERQKFLDRVLMRD